MLDTNTQIIYKIEQLEAYAHTFKFTLDEENNLARHVLSIINQHKKHYFISYIKLINTKEAGFEKINYKEIYLQMGRDYYLEFANQFIKNRDRLELLYQLIGKKQFASIKHDTHEYLIHPNLTIDWLKLLNSSEYGQHAIQHIYYKKLDRHVNMFEAYVFENEGYYYAVMRQTNITSKSTKEMDYIIELALPHYTQLSEIEGNQARIDYLFGCIGRLYLKSIPYRAEESKEKKTGTPKTELSDEDFEKELESILGQQRESVSNSLKDFTDKFINIESSPLRYELDILEESYLELYSRSIDFLKTPSNPHFALQLETSLVKYSEIIGADPIFFEIVELLQILARYVREGKLTEVVIEDISFHEIYISFVESLDEWQKTLFLRKSHSTEEMATSTLDFINNIQYINSLLEI